MCVGGPHGKLLDVREQAAAVSAPADPTPTLLFPCLTLLAPSPSNPLGVTYSEDQMRDLLAWCLMRRCHCIRCVWTSRNDLVDLPLNLQIFNLP